MTGPHVSMLGLTLGRAWDLVERLTASLAACPAVQHVEPAGDLRRASPIITSIVLICRVEAPSDALPFIVAALDFTDVRTPHARGLTATWRGTTIDILMATPDDYGSVLFAATGDEAHVQAVRRRGLADRAFATEAQLYESVGLTFVPPELRSDTGELDASAAGRLPALVSVSDMRGDLHMHSSYSDGRDPVAAMVEAAAALGYEYMAMTDHSAGAMASRTLAIDEIARQHEEIDRLRERFPQMAILHGVEVDILEDGRLGFADGVLERFDLVIASLHESWGHDGDRLTARAIAAMRHPLVSVLCHPANRMPGRHEGYDLDFNALYAAAVETGTALEIDGSPSHLDLPSDRAREAVAAGVTVTIDSDCHRSDLLARQMGFGVGLARAGWVESRHVLNTRPFAELERFIAAKR